jgi:integrase
MLTVRVATVPKLTKTIVESAEPRPRQFTIWCSELKGFGVYILPTGKRTYFADYRNADGSRKRMTLGRHGVITCEEARKLAVATLGGVVKGADPAAERASRRAALTVSELCDLYLEAADKGLVTTRFHKPKRASTLAVDRGRIGRHIVPLVGSKKADRLTRADIQRMADDIAGGKTAGTFKTKLRGKAVVTGGAGTARRVVELFGGIWTWAERRGHVAGRSPAHGVETQKGDPKDRILSPPELARLGAVLKEKEEAFPFAVAAVRLILLTGARREEVVGLRWSEFDAAGSCLRLEKTKTGRSMRPIGSPVVALLSALPRDENEFVFPNRSGKRPADLKKQIAGLFDAAGLDDARSHDCRRTFSTTADELGYSEATAGAIIGHASRGVTARHYIRRPDAALVEAADKVAKLIERRMKGIEAQVVELPRGQKGEG